MIDTPSLWFWNCIGIAIAVSSLGFSWSLFRAHNFRLETENHKLEINAAVEEVRKVSDTIKESAELLPTNKRVNVNRELDQVSKKLLETQKEILSDDEVLKDE